MNKNPLREPISAATKILQMEPQNETHKKKKKTTTLDEIEDGVDLVGVVCSEKLVGTVDNVLG